MRGSAACRNVPGFAVSMIDPGSLFHIQTVLGNIANLYFSPKLEVGCI